MRTAEVLAPRTVSHAVGRAPVRYRPWVEVSARVTVRLGGWGHEASEWLHWAMPVRDGTVCESEARRFDPGLRAAQPGAPPLPDGLPGLPPSEQEIGDSARRLWAGFSATVQCSPDLGVVSRLDESRDEFRRRCMALLGPALPRDRSYGGEVAARLGRLAEAIETVRLGPESLELCALLARVAWYPDGEEPSVNSAVLMLSGPLEGGI